MRVTALGLFLGLFIAGVPACFAQIAPPEMAKPCMAARIFAPPEVFTMPVVKPEQIRDGVVSPAPACRQAQPHPIVVKRLRIIQSPPAMRKLQLVPNPFAPPGKSTPSVPKPE